jgi:NADH-quinone oxidoreductase subunit K
MLIMFLSLNDYLLVFVSIFFISLFGLIVVRKNFILVLICLYLLLISCAFGFVVAATFIQSIHGYFYALFLLTVAASETAIGLGLLMVLHQFMGSVNLDLLYSIRG